MPRRFGALKSDSTHHFFRNASFVRYESGRFGALKSDSTHHFFRNACFGALKSDSTHHFFRNACCYSDSRNL